MATRFKKNADGELIGPAGLVIRRSFWDRTLWILELRREGCDPVEIASGLQRKCRAVADRLCDPAEMALVAVALRQRAAQLEDVGRKTFNRWPGYRDLWCRESGGLMETQGHALDYAARALLVSRTQVDHDIDSCRKRLQEALSKAEAKKANGG